MHPLLVIVAVAGGWLVYAGVLGVVMARRGHRRLTWTLIALATGPVALAIAVVAAVRGESIEQETVLVGRAGSGTVAIVAGVDGSVSAQRAVETAVEWLGPRISSLQLVGVLDLDAGLGDGVEQRQLGAAVRDVAARAASLIDARRGVPRLEPEGLLRTGRAASVLLEAASVDRHLLVVGRPGDGDDVVREIVGHATVPILVGR